MSFARLFLTRPVLRIKRYTSNQNTIFRKYCQGNIDLSDTSIQKYLQHLVQDYNDLHTKTKRSLQESMRLRDIEPVVKVLDERLWLYQNIDNLKELHKKEDKDEELKKMVKEEAEIYLNKLKEIDSDLLSALLEPNVSEGGVLLEVTAGAGGQEAMLFARELFEMYESYATFREWEVDIASLEKSDLGGIRKGAMLIEGIGVPELMRVEAGVHRVQRIPATERSGRIHTSTVSVAVLPQPTEVELEITDRELQIDTKRASGAGGQHVNTTDSAVRITHLPSGTVVECQEGRSQIKNKQIAMQKLRTLLLQKQCSDQTSKINAERRSQVGSGERNEKIRTYNYAQDRVTEHRPGGGTTHSLKTFMEGGEQLAKLQEDLLRNMHYQALMDEVKQFSQKEESAA